MAYIEIKHLTKDYGKKRGIFDMSLEVEKGEIYGFVGVNGAGKTTTIRHMMGFLTPDEGTVTINGLDANKSSAEVKRYVSYIPGEINFPGNSTGEDFIKNQIYLSGRGDWEYAENVIDQLQLDAKANVRAMSKGMKQKTAIVSAFASDADILIMDEPTTGLDPLMRDIFIELLKEEKAKGKTIFMSSHIFQEVEEVCDRVAIIRDGMIIDVIDMKDIRYNKMKTYKMEFKSIEDFEHFRSLGYDLHRVKVDDLQLNIMIHDQDINRLIQDLKNFNLVYFKEIKVTFEDYVTQVFKGEK
ncbi:MAG: ATP-binding cassette domain-containing protein [Trichococcus flocculiformis]|jgi:ABC-2 type transport system ATP-binding protein|uniref:ABC-2 type transport system ATP-binding protein n=3 Tax=Trichococcus TaxID=82802 RepID=A0AB38BJX0_9LACT|nr:MULTISPECIES: ATP-binding cassette domain-containing protein [Trichococcus]HRM09018.1 ATP-binding cassette domain-containing protein [Phocaeicola vulgatus]CZQ91152.1 abc transporter [Trichococcus sp. ES5]CZR01163.1 abc transporter [Trichococcus flocculiformis]SFF04423.1 ABC-2 type transport system ATP-binding protein [Trichococcus pasteurii]SFI01792.1 ABC-2 type transport system ATP-binding protein [Trichococcus flocculiformis]